MSPAELAVVAALGASTLTGLASLGVVWFQQRLQARSADRDAVVAAVTEMLSRSLAVSLRASVAAEAMKLRSGLSEGLDVTMRIRRPFDPMELNDWLAQDLAPLNAAWSVIWARGDQELIQRANALLSSCSDLISVCTERMPAATQRARLRRYFVGDRWTEEMLANVQKAREAMAHDRERLAQYARRLVGLPQTQLFGHPGAADLGASRTKEPRQAIRAGRPPNRAGGLGPET